MGQCCCKCCDGDEEEPILDVYTVEENTPSVGDVTRAFREDTPSPRRSQSSTSNKTDTSLHRSPSIRDRTTPDTLKPSPILPRTSATGWPRLREIGTLPPTVRVDVDTAPSWNVRAPSGLSNYTKQPEKGVAAVSAGVAKKPEQVRITERLGEVYTTSRDLSTVRAPFGRGVKADVSNRDQPPSGVTDTSTKIPLQLNIASLLHKQLNTSTVRRTPFEETANTIRGRSAERCDNLASSTTAKRSTTTVEAGVSHISTKQVIASQTSRTGALRAPREYHEWTWDGEAVVVENSTKQFQPTHRQPPEFGSGKSEAVQSVKRHDIILDLLHTVQTHHSPVVPTEGAFMLEDLDHRSLSFVHNKLFKNNRFNELYRITMTKRIWNPYLMLQYSLNKRRYGDKFKEVHMYHGTSLTSVSGILAHNFNWRMTNENTLGQGVYFANNPYFASHYGKRRNCGNPDYAMIVAKVLVEETDIPRGFAFFVPPPGHSTTNDNKQELVKFDDGCFYPEFLVLYRPSKV